MLPGSEVITRVACAIARSEVPCGGFSSVVGGETAELSGFRSKASPAVVKCGGRAENVLSAGDEVTEDFLSSMRVVMDASVTGFEFNCGFVADVDGAPGLYTEIPNDSRTLLPDFLRGGRFRIGGISEECERGDESLDGCCEENCGVSLGGTASARWGLGFPFCHHVPIQSPIEALSCLA